MVKTVFILNFFKLYNILWRIALPLLRKNKRLRPGFEKRITTGHLKKADIWLQAASAGEAYLAVSLIKSIAANHTPGKKIRVLATSITEQGLEILNEHLDNPGIRGCMNLRIEWFPFDLPATMHRAVHAVSPGVMVLLETEIWPALLWSLRQKGAKIYIVNARLSAKSFSIYRQTRFLWKHLAPDMVLATSGRDAQRYATVFEKSCIKTMPNIKFESLNDDETETGIREKLFTILPSKRPLTILASVRKPEEKQVTGILKSILESFPDQVVAVFPRHMHRVGSWEKHLSDLEFDYCLRSEIQKGQKIPQVILWDTFGELKAAYEFARVVFVGGSLAPLGGQNFIEPAMAGAVTVTGPSYDDFIWVGDAMFKTDIVIKKNTPVEIVQTILSALRQDPHSTGRQAFKKKAFDYIHAHHGGSDLACREILKAFDGSI